LEVGKKEKVEEGKTIPFSFPVGVFPYSHDNLLSTPRRWASTTQGKKEREVEKVGFDSLNLPGEPAKLEQLERLQRVRKEIKENLDNGFSPKDLGKINLLLDLIDDELVEEYNKGYGRVREVVLPRLENSFNRRRSEIEVLASILEVAQKGGNKTKILHKSNLSYTQLKKYLQFMVEKGLMEVGERGRGNIYTTTVKGLLFLTAWKRMITLLE
jgi:predicted transcriptional regulator